jgi:carbon starvation protein
MNSLLVAFIALILLYLGYSFYSKIIERLWKVDPERKTPAHELQDGIDYIPARHWTILFGHHFASIAGAGPIIGPIVAAIIWGWVPSLIWIVLGSILIGGVHDFSALMASLREKGKSIAEVAETTLSFRAKLILAAFVWLALVLVISVFAAVAAKTLISSPEVVIPTFGLILIAVFVGYLIYYWRVNQVIATLIGIGLLFLVIVLGYKFPVSPEGISIKFWILVLLAYAFVASILPVNILLQPRDYLSAFILFFGLFFGFIGLIITHPPMHAPAFGNFMGKPGPLWPMLFVLIACGAISGFHSLVATGTTPKQLPNERDARRIAYGGMILEGVLAILALLAVTAGLYWGKGPEGLVYNEFMKGAKPDWIGAFGAGYGQLTKPIFGEIAKFIGIVMLNAFVMTTLDTATRICRYIGEELFGTGLRLSALKNRYLMTTIIILLALYLAFGSWKAIWPIFGASNQLVAALVLIVITVYFFAMKQPTKFTLYPAIFMLITTVAALSIKTFEFFKTKKIMLGSIGTILIILAVFIVIESFKVVKRLKAQP